MFFLFVFSFKVNSLKDSFYFINCVYVLVWSEKVMIATFFFFFLLNLYKYLSEWKLIIDSFKLFIVSQRFNIY